MATDFFPKLLNLIQVVGGSSSAPQPAEAKVKVSSTVPALLQPREDPRDRYDIQIKIGQGAYGVVYRAWDIYIERKVAIKIINLEDIGDDIDDINQEIAIMSEISCKNLIKYYASYVVGSFVWIVMEFLEAGSASEIVKELGPFDEGSAAFILKELLTALEYLHQERKIHRDVKAGNLLVSGDGNIKLADFGVTGQLTETMDKRKTRVGTPFWMAPEVITESSYDGCADIWSTGITAIELVTGAPPYANKVHPMQVIFLIPKNPPPVLEGAFSDDFKDFVAKCLQKEASKRPTAQQLLDHPFIKNASKTESLIKIAQHKCEVNQARHENDLADLEQKGMNRVLSSDMGWDFSMRSQNSGAFNSLGSFSSASIDGSKDVNDMTMPRISRAHSSSSFNSPVYTPHGVKSPINDLTPSSKSSYQLKTGSARSFSLLVESPIREGLARPADPINNPLGYKLHASPMSSKTFAITTSASNENLRRSVSTESNGSFVGSATGSAVGSAVNSHNGSFIGSGTGANYYFVGRSTDMGSSDENEIVVKNNDAIDASLARPFYTVLNILRRQQKEKADGNSPTYSEIFDTVVRPTLQRITDLSYAAADDSESSEIKNDPSDDEKKKELRDVITVLIGAFTALDVSTKGTMSTEFTTTMMGYMLEQLEGNIDLPEPNDQNKEDIVEDKNQIIEQNVSNSDNNDVINNDDKIVINNDVISNIDNNVINNNVIENNNTENDGIKISKSSDDLHGFDYDI